KKQGKSRAQKKKLDKERKKEISAECPTNMSALSHLVTSEVMENWFKDNRRKELFNEWDMGTEESRSILLKRANRYSLTLVSTIHRSSLRTVTTERNWCVETILQYEYERWFRIPSAIMNQVTREMHAALKAQRASNTKRTAKGSFPKKV